MSGTTVDPNAPLSVTLRARQWNSLMVMVGEGVNALNAILSDVQQQCLLQSQPDERFPETVQPRRANGAAAAAQE